MKEKKITAQEIVAMSKSQCRYLDKCLRYGTFGLLEIFYEREITWWETYKGDLIFKQK